jgi:CheY-like chemotaxis protein
MGSMDLGARLAMRQPLSAAARSGEPIDPAQLVAQLGGEVANALSTALERVNALATTGRIDRSDLRALRDEIELARRIGMMGQQVSRFASGRVRVTQERLDLTGMLRAAMQQRSREIEARGIEVRQQLRPAEVVGDATLTFSLLQAMLDWAFEHARSRVDFAIDTKPWPVQARLACSFAYRQADEAADDQPALDTMSWRLLQQTANLLGLALGREDRGGRSQVLVEFPQTVGSQIEGVTAVELDDPSGQVENSKPLAGSHVLVVAARKELRNLVRESLRPLGLMLDYVTSVEQAREFCAGGMPHAVVHEAALGGDGFEALRQELLAEVPTLAFIQITDDGKAFEVRNVGDRQFASVGRAAIVDSLPSALLFELARCA